ncbi:MAG TPA: hypothetical protein VFU38_08505 [Candidatus Krumholzibacteria bacterium]|nr:hypothetical protein [Candidatus Krumholzibacteria bacterium]
MKRTLFWPLGILLGVAIACTQKSTDEMVVLKTYPMTGSLDVLSQDLVQLDNAISSDGNGAARVHVDGPTTIRLYETGDLDIEQARIIYEAKLRTEAVEGPVYLEMWCSVPGKGEFFSRALQSPLTGTTEWTSQQTPFFLKKGENPDNVKLNLVVGGKGTVWIDDVKLTKGPLGDV